MHKVKVFLTHHCFINFVNSKHSKQFDYLQFFAFIKSTSCFAKYIFTSNNFVTFQNKFLSKHKVTFLPQYKKEKNKLLLKINTQKLCVLENKQGCIMFPAICSPTGKYLSVFFVFALLLHCVESSLYSFVYLKDCRCRSTSQILECCVQGRVCRSNRPILHPLLPSKVQEELAKYFP